MRRSIATVLLLAVVPQLGALWGEFIQDDILILLRSPIVTGERPAWHAFTTGYWEFFPADTPELYRPLPVFAFALEWRLWGEAPVAFRAINLACHALVSLLVLGVFRRIARDPGVALAGAALFAVHPLHAEAICPAVGRLELFAALGAAGAVWLHLRDHTLAGLPRAAVMGLALAGVAVAMLSKESAVCIPALLILAGLCRPGRTGEARRTRTAMIGASILVVGAVLLIRRAVIGPPADVSESQTLFVNNPLIGLEWFARLGVALRVIGYELWLLTVPWKPLGDYSYNTFDIGRPWLHAGTAASVLVITALLALAVRVWRTRPEVTFAAGWFALSLGIASNLLFTTGTIMAERLLYLPSAGLCLGLALALHSLSPSRRAFAGLSAAVVLLFAARSAVRVLDFRTGGALYMASWEANPHSAATATRLGNLYAGLGQLPEARICYETALGIRPQLINARIQYVAVLTRMGLESEALEQARLTAQLGPDSAPAHGLWADLALEAGRVREALEVLTRAVERWPEEAEAHLLLGDARRALGDRDGALAAYRRSLELAPGEAIAWHQLGDLLAEMRQPEEAIDALERAAALDAGVALFRRRLAELLWQQGRRDEARAALAEALRLAPDDAGARGLERRWGAASGPR